MKLQLNSNGRFNIRIQVVKKYFESNSLNEVASSFNIHPITLRRWIKRYQKGGENNLKTKKVYKRHPKRFALQIEEKIVLLKENNPVLTVSKARDILNKQGVKVSAGGIWNVWKRYNLAGQSEKAVDWKTSEIEHGLKNVRDYFEKGELHQAAQILNTLPHCPDKELLKKIPDELLSLPKQQEKLNLLLSKVPFPDLMHKARAIRERAERENMHYTVLRAGAIELTAMDWLGFHKEQLLLARKLKKKIEKIKGRNSCSPVRRFGILMAEALALARLGRIKDALLCVQRCKNFCKYPVYSSFLGHMASFYSGIGFHKKARKWLTKSLKFNKNNPYTHEMLAADMAMAGEYGAALKILRRLKSENVTITTLSTITNALCSLGQGKIEDTARFANQSLAEAKEEAIPFYLWSSTLTLASCLSSSGDREKARSLIKRVSLQLKKFRIRHNDLLARIILGQNRLPQDATLMPDVRLATFLNQASKSLRIKDYRKAFNYAATQRLIGFFHRLIPLFPGPVNRLIVKGKSTGLPRQILRLPVFNKKIPVFNVKFLGNFRVYKNQQYLKTKLKPKDGAFLLYLCFKATERGKSVKLNEIYANFWPKNANPSGNLSHLLLRIKKALKMPSHLLTISTKTDYPSLINEGIYFTTDYQELEQVLTRAKALERAGEWGFAKKEYLRAFKLFRGEPFKKNYDDWSVNLRFKILTQLETEAVNFAKNCIKHGNKTDARKILQKVLKIIPDSEESRQILREII